ncbi:MAG: sigma-70 family RNA polymerase sigma factor [Gemmatimonadetes bacterium]|nr:sigma-70 family RNA polymerase sigma factor [Gemmatimonadota bacterium]
MSTRTNDDTYNVRLCLDGNANAFEPLVRRYQNAAFAVALGYLQNRSDAEDVVQDAFISAFCKLSQLKDPAVFGSWFHRIVVNRCKEWIRRSKIGRRVRVDANSDGLRDEHAMSDRIHRKYIERLELWNVVEKLPVHYRDVVSLYYYTGFSLKEIAAFLDIPESTARGRLYQSRIRLREALSLQEKESIAMSQIDVTAEVQDVVCKLAREDLEETIDMGDVENIVLYCGVSTEVEIIRTEGEQLLVRGSKIGLGYTDEEARHNLGGFAVSHDTVDDFYKSGPHEGELFVGVDSSGNENTAMTSRISDHWRRDLMNNWMLDEVCNGVRLVDLYPDLKSDIDAFPPLPKKARESLSKSVRISVHTMEVRPIHVPNTALTGSIKDVFQVYWSDASKVFGPASYCHVSIEVPAGKNISVFRAKRINAEGLNGSLMVYACQSCQITDIAKDVYLFNSMFSDIHEVGGMFCQRMYEFGAANYLEGTIRNKDVWEGKLSNVKGGVDIDVGRLVLDAQDLAGDVSIYNRFGTTRFYQSSRESGTRCNLRTVSGETKLVLDESLAKKVSLVMYTRCGVLKLGKAKNEMRMYSTYNDGHRITAGTTYDTTQADYLLLTESGTAEVELLNGPDSK